MLSRYLFCPEPQQAAREGRLVWPRPDLEGGHRVLEDRSQATVQAAIPLETPDQFSVTG